ncbi:uncharacterized protein [Cherax quadricarinatus]|uniref:uncharacterized protein n=1 Tax=Cherax quadricarinatus TaxID=27406 RepID=UPI00387E770D
MPLFCCVCVALCYYLMVQTTNTLKTWRFITQIFNTQHLATFTQNTRGDAVLDQTQHNASRTITTHKMKEKEFLPWWESGECDCVDDDCVPGLLSRKTFPRVASSISMVGGTCGRRSWAAGGGQRVVSLSLYGHNPEYWRGLNDIITQVGRVYPGWRVRLYTDPRGRGRILCPLLHAHAHFDVCDITRLPPPLGDLSAVNPMMWRVAPLGDVQVTVLQLRDTDSMIIQREVDAVRDWLSSDKQFHIMRDHPNHDFALMGGLWGVRWDPDPTEPAARNQDPSAISLAGRSQYPGSTGLPIGDQGSDPTRFADRNQVTDNTRYTGHFLAVFRDIMLTKAKDKEKQMYGGDIYILEEILWPVMQFRVLTHDSYYCGDYENDTVPWPTQRVDGRFAGFRRYKKKFENEKIPEECPKRCRPPEHPEWHYC